MNLSIITITRDNPKDLIRSYNSYNCYFNKPNVEIIVIDGSTTNSSIENTIVRNVKNLKIFKEKPTGITNAFNAGIQYAKGEWLIFVNAGDELINQNLETLVEGNKNDLVYGISEIYNSETNKIVGFQGKSISNWPPSRMPFNHQSAIYRRTIFSKYGLFDPKFKLGMDYEHLLRLNFEKIEFKNEIIGRFHLGGVSSNAKGVYLDWKNARIKNGFSILFSNLLYFYFLFRLQIKSII